MTLFRSTFTELVFPFLLTFGVLTCILLMEKVYGLVSLMVEKKFEVQEAGLMLLYLVPQVFTITIPLGVVGAVFMTVIRQSVDSEMVCLRATGTSLWFYSLPILLFGFVATGANFVNTVIIAPHLYHNYAELEARIIKAHADEKLVPGKFNYDFGSKAIQVGGRSPDNELSDIFIADEAFGRASSAILASKGRIEVDEVSEQVFFRLRDGAIYAAAANDPKTFRTVDFVKLDYRLEFKTKGSVSSSVVKRDSTTEIWERMQTKGPADPLYSRWAVEFYTRMTFPWSCLVFALAALPMAIVDPRSGRSGSFMRAVFLVLAYYIIWIAFKDLVRGGSAPAGVLWLPLLLIGFFGLFRLWQTNSDIRLLSLVWRR